MPRVASPRQNPSETYAVCDSWPPIKRQFPPWLSQPLDFECMIRATRNNSQNQRLSDNGCKGHILNSTLT
eukprot:scaffold252965_cov37-Prasinocladus_malaysianus.AAC.2